MRAAIATCTNVQLVHRTNRWELSMWVADGRHDGTVTYTLHVKDCGGVRDRTLQIQTEDEEYEIVSEKEWAQIQEHYPNERKYITEAMARAFGYMPAAACEFLTLRWDALNLIVTPSLQ